MAKAVKVVFYCISLTLLLVPDLYAQSIYAGGNGDGFSQSSFAQPDNILFNIYNGGNADGFASNSFAQPDNILFDIYKGGTEDGFSSSSFAQPDNILFDIYKGGSEDGFSTSSFAQPDNILFDIYKGGAEDGFSTSSFAQPDNVLFDIYKGGLADGFSLSSFAQPDNVLFDIYRGGIGDGFAFNKLGSIGTEVPLPIELVTFEGRFQGGAISILWKTSSELNNERFVLEHSVNGLNFEKIYSIDGAGTTTHPKEYKYTDRSPYPGINYYRLKQIDFDQTFTYSKIIAVEASEQPAAPLLIFPNPSDQSDIIQLVLKGVIKGTPALVKIRTASGQQVYFMETVVDEYSQIKIDRRISSELAPGFYLVSVQLVTGMHVVKWIVK